jgi:5-methylphenazine-1-carboxylate 1-monooxygenase
MAAGLQADVAIIGGGICGLALALNLHQRGLRAAVYERVPDVREIGVGITLLPHAMRECTALGLAQELVKSGIENKESLFFNRFGQRIYGEECGKFAGYPYPEIAIHRGRLHRILYDSCRAKIGGEFLRTNCDCVGIEQDDSAATVFFKETTSGQTLPPARAKVIVACDGINSVIRKQFYPNDRLAYAGINTWRGVSRRKPILGGRSYLRIGSILTGKIVIYPIADESDGNQRVNWVAELRQDTKEENRWNKPGNIADFIRQYESWRFDWLDVPALIRSAESVLEYPMVDKEPIDRWTFGRVTLAGDAAHPMYPRGSNGAAQAMIDARTLADLLQTAENPRSALKAYEQARLETTARIVRTNREQPPDFINIKVEELVGDRPFENLDDYITQDELRALSARYKKIAGFSLPQVAQN